MSLLATKDKDHFLVVSYTRETNELSIKRVLDLSGVNFKQDYIHYCDLKSFRFHGPSPFTIQKIDSSYRYYQTQYLVFNKHELDLFNQLTMTLNDYHELIDKINQSEKKINLGTY